MSDRRWFRIDDAADRAHLLLILTYTVPVSALLGLAVAVYASARLGAGARTVVLILIAGPLVGLIAGIAAWLAVGGVSRSLVRIVTAGGSSGRHAGFSFEESLIARGRYREAAAAFEQRLAASPDDDEIRLALAALYAAHIHDPELAERLLVEVRSRAGEPRLEFRAANALIDLYAATGDRTRQIRELARFADRWRGSAAAARARERLAELKTQDAGLEVLRDP